MMQTEVDTGTKLKRLRRGAGLTQTELAKKAGVSQSAIGMIESGQRKEPHPHTLAKLAKALGVPTADLLEDQ
jgi:transcriptional regulator with XRE-family HTH domain